MIDRPAAVGLTALVGMAVALQAPINSMLGKRVGTLPAATVQFTIGLGILIALTFLIGGGFGDLGRARGAPWYYFLGGAFGAAYIATVLMTVRSLGASGVTAATIGGQLSMSIAIDHFGLLGIQRQPITLPRLAGVVLLAAGTFLVVRY